MAAGIVYQGPRPSRTCRVLCKPANTPITEIIEHMPKAIKRSHSDIDDSEHGDDFDERNYADHTESPDSKPPAKRARRATTNTTTATGRKTARKTAHSIIERRRRGRMNAEFSTLRDLIPSCEGRAEMHKLAILQASIGHVHELCQRIAELEQQLADAKADERTRRYLDPPYQSVDRNDTGKLGEQFPTLISPALTARDHDTDAQEEKCHEIPNLRSDREAMTALMMLNCDRRPVHLLTS